MEVYISSDNDKVETFKPSPPDFVSDFGHFGRHSMITFALGGGGVVRSERSYFKRFQRLTYGTIT